MNIHKILGFIIELLTTLIISLSNCGETYNFSEYGNITRVFQFNDEKLLLSTNTANNVNLLHLIYPNGSIVPINYEDNINFNNNSEWRIGFCFPLAINYVILIYYDKKESLTDLSIHGTIINLQGKITTKDMVMLRHYNSSASTDYFITRYDGFPQSFLISYPKDGYLNWTKCIYSDDGIVTQVSYGSIIPVVDTFTFISHQPFSTLDGQYAVVYLIKSTNKTDLDILASYLYHNASENIIYSIYAHFINGQDQISEEHLLFQDSSDNAINLVSLSGCMSGFDAFNIQSNGCTFSYYLIRFATSKILKISTAFITFSSSGTVIQRDVISTDDLVNSSTAELRAISIFQLPYGGFISFNQIDLNESHYSQVVVYNLNYTSNYKLFEVVNETIVNYGIYNNNTLWLTYGNMTAGRKLVMLDVERFSNDSDYDNSVILSTYPTLNMTVPLSYTDHFNITLSVPVVPSSGNISIYQIVDQDKYLLRQSYPASSYCKVYNISTLTCKTLFSTFNRVNSNYTIVVYDNFVKTLSFNEPLQGIYQGIYQGIWNVKTPQTYNSTVSFSTEVLMRLNPDGTKYFLSYDQANRTQLLDDMLQQIRKSIPLNDDRLKITSNVQLDPSDSTKLLIEFSVDKAINPSKEPSVNDIINDLNDIITNKYISALSDKKHMIFFDDQYGFQPKPNLWLETRYKLLILLIIVIILLIIYLLAKRKYPKGQNFMIFKISLIILGLILDFSFIIVNGHDVPSLFIPSTNVEALNALSSNFAGLEIFSALVSENFKKWILYGTTCHLFIKEIPQLVIQIIYQRSVIIYASIPLLTLVTSTIILSNNILTSIYYFWINQNIKKELENAEQRNSLLF
ncbi:hypothetical protein F8M41_009040 [Gigaspora margarita]|uniref:Uncharacterized protein n=1 Tax=Gigaspora margarita TaxID=4874 RepID=A0A8H3X4E2_GIGMA|nr:hypothetical protein F8M41_009040 [Gigaspora margarita]